MFMSLLALDWVLFNTPQYFALYEVPTTLPTTWTNIDMYMYV